MATVADGNCEDDRRKPSDVTDEEYLWARKPGGYHHNEKNGGKWLIHLDKRSIDGKGDTDLDRAWSSIKALVQQGTLYDCKCTTNFSDPYKSDGIGVITCYTPNFRDYDDIKRVAAAINGALSLKMPMYYDVLYNSILGYDTAKSLKEISIYKLQMNGNLFCRENHEWKFLKFVTDDPLLQQCDIVMEFRALDEMVMNYALGRKSDGDCVSHADPSTYFDRLKKEIQDL